MSTNVTYLQGDADKPAPGDFDRSDPWICDELVYMLQQQNQVHNKWRHKHLVQAFDYKNSSGDEIANVNFYAVRPGS